jgi:hypothetical protein
MAFRAGKKPVARKALGSFCTANPGLRPGLITFALSGLRSAAEARDIREIQLHA